MTGNPEQGAAASSFLASNRSRSTPGVWPPCSPCPSRRRGGSREHLKRLAPARARASTGLHVARRRRQTRRALVACRRVAARQFPHRSRRPSRHPARPAARLFPAAAADRRRRIRGPAAHLRDGARARFDAARDASTRSALHRFVTAFQSVTPLTMGELWAWPSALKLALVGTLCAREQTSSRRAAPTVSTADRLVDALDTPARAAPSLAVTGASRVRHPPAPAVA